MFSVLIPRVDGIMEGDQWKPITVYAIQKEDSILKGYLKHKTGIEKYVQRPKARGRENPFVKSKKNFEITDEEGIGDYAKFEKLKENVYKLTLSHPFSVFQAAGVILSRFEKDVIKSN